MSIFEYARSKKEPPANKAIAPSSEGTSTPENVSPIFQFARQNKPEPIQEESKTKEALRHTARSTSRSLESIGGIPGDIARLPGRAIQYVSEKIAGRKLPELEKARSRFEKFLIPGTALPGSAELRKKTREFAGEYLEPQTPTEEFADTIISDASSMLIPVKGKIPFVSALTSSVGANLIDKGLEKVGVSEETRGKVKMVTLFLGPLLNRNGAKGAEKYASSLYKKAEAALPEGAQIEAKSLTNNLTNLRDKVSKGTLAPSEKFIVDEVDAILKKIKDGKLSPQEAWASKRSLTEKLQEFVYKTEDKASRARARKLGKGIQDELNGVLKEYGKKNPEFYKYLTEADEAFGTIAQSKGVSRFIGKHAKLGTISGIGAVGLEILTNPAAIAPTVGGAAGTAIVLKSAELAYRVAKSPVLRKYYSQILNDALIQDSAALNKSLEQFDKAINEDKEIMELLKDLKEKR